MPGDTLRLNTTTPVTPLGSQSRLGLLGGDDAGYPNGRRPGDDVVDLFFRAQEGGFRPNGHVPPVDSLGDGVDANDAELLDTFPYLSAPHLTRAGTLPTETP